MRIFVAGATGVVGRRLVPLLVAQGHEVTALSRRPAAPGTDARASGTRAVETGVGRVTHVVGDVFDRVGLTALVAAARPEVVIHQLTDLGTRDFAANSRIRREGTRHLVDAALAAGVRRVISQSIAWAYEPGSAPADESTPLDVRSADEARRTTVEAVATLETITAEAPEWVVLRYGLLYGPGTWYTTGGLMATAQLPTGPDLTSFLHVDDAAEAAVAALSWPSGAVNIVDDEPLPASTWAPAFAESVGAPPPTAPPASAHTPPAPTTADGPTTPVDGRTASTDGRTAWARGATNAYARGLGWTPTHPTFLDSLA